MSGAIAILAVAVVLSIGARSKYAILIRERNNAKRHCFLINSTLLFFSEALKSQLIPSDIGAATV